MRHARLFRKLGFALLLSALLLLEDLEVLKAKDLIGDGDLTVSDGSWGKVYGMQRQPQSGDAQTENAHLTINGGAVSSSIYGGYARSNDGAARAGGNEVTITGIQGSPGTLYGGYARSASNAAAAANRLTISGAPSFSGSSAYGGRADASGGTSGLYLATNNHVTIDITTSLYQVFGGSISAVSNDTADVGSYGNEVIIRQGTIEEVYGGRASGSGMVDVSGNRISISGGSVTQIIGGNAYSKHQIAVADDNAIIITGGTHENIIAASVQSDSMQVSASNNAVYLSNTTVKGVTGGYSTSTDTAASLNYNSIVVGAEAVVTSNVHGGDAIGTGDGNSAAHNSISVVQGGQIHGELVGGNLKGAGDVSNNTIQISGSKVDGNVSGGQTAGDGIASGNSISVENGSVGGNLVAGNVGGKGDVSNNTIQISGSSVGGSVSGGRTADDGVADNNSVSVENSSVSGNLVAGYVGGTGDVSNNSIQISGGKVDGHVSGGHSTGNGIAGGNSISVSNGGTISGNLVAGDVGGTGDVSNNTIQISGSKVDGNVSGGQAAKGGSADHNTIAIVQGGSVTGDLLGGDLGGAGSASHNTILVNNGSADGDIIGGRTAAGGSATGNSIILGQQAQLAPTSNLFGGIVGEQAVAPQGSGNTLFVDSWQGTVERAAGFANLHFVLPTPGTPAADVPMLTVTSAQQGDFTGTTVTAQLPDIITGGSAHIGETFVLIKDGSGAINQADIGGLVGLLHGYATIYDGVIFDENNSIVIRVEDVRANPLAGALTEARIGAAGLLNQGGDLIAGSALRAADTAARETRGWAAFATLSGGAASLTTETDVTTRGLSLVAGLARHSEAAWADTLIGAFFETGYGNLATAREAAGEIIKGYGYTRYTGGGLLARLDITQGFLRGLYLEASGRAGEITTSWSSDDLLDNMDRPAEYDLTTPYYGGHAGLGYLLPLNETWTLDLYGKYLFAHQEGQDTTINGDSFHFDAVDSGRLRCGTRLSGTVSPSGSVYLGAAWEQEVYGTARAASRSSNMSVPSTAMTGSSALFELGFTVTPEQSPLRLDMALEGSAGTRRSIGGHVHMVYEF